MLYAKYVTTTTRVCVVQVDGRDQLFACAAYGCMMVTFFAYACYLFARPLQQRQHPPLSASYVEDLGAPELANFPHFVSVNEMLESSPRSQPSPAADCLVVCDGGGSRWYAPWHEQEILRICGWSGMFVDGSLRQMMDHRYSHVNGKTSLQPSSHVRIALDSPAGLGLGE